MSLNQQIASAVGTGKCKIGAKLVVVAANCPRDERDDIERYAQLGGIKVTPFEGTSWDLGEAVGKPFMISAIAVIEPGDSKILKQA